MKAISEKKKGSYVVGGKQAGQPEYYPLEVVRTDDGALLSSWKPSWSDVWNMVRGKPIRVGILSERQPPIWVEVY